MAKDLIDSEDPKHTLFCRETAFVAIYALFYNIFVAKTRNYDIFVAKIYDYALIDSFWGFPRILDSPTSYATLSQG